MAKAIAARVALVTTAAALVLALSGGPSSAHNDWGLPLLGGLVGGYGISTLMQKHSETEPRQYVPPPPPPTYVQPVPNAVAPAPAAGATAAHIEQQLNVLDDLAAKGYVTPSEYKERRQALLNQL